MEVRHEAVIHGEVLHSAAQCCKVLQKVVRGQRLRGASELRLRLRAERLSERGDKREYSHNIERKEWEAKKWQTLRSAAVFGSFSPTALSSGVLPF